MANEFLPYSESFYETTLTNAMTAAQTTMVVGTAPTQQSGYLVIEPKSSNREIVKFTSASGTTLTVVRGLSETAAYDDSSGTGKTHAAGVQVAMKDVHYYFNKVTAAYRGEEVTGYNSFYLGDGNALSTGNRFWYAATSSVSAFWGLSSSGKAVVSEDGVTSYVISAGGSGVTAGNGISITAGVVATDILSTGSLEISASKIAVQLNDTSLARTSSGLYVDYDNKAPTVEQLSGATASEVSAFFSTTDITGAQAEELTDGSTTTLHTHSFNNMLVVDPTSTTLTNDDTRTQFFTQTLPANTLGTNNGVRVRMYVSNLRTNSGNVSFFLQYGTTDVASMTTSLNASLSYNGVIEFILMANGATNAQKGICNGVLGLPNGSATHPYAVVNYGGSSGSEDSTGALNLDIDVDFSATDASNTITVQGATYEILT